LHDVEHHFCSNGQYNKIQWEGIKLHTYWIVVVICLYFWSFSFFMLLNLKKIYFFRNIISCFFCFFWAFVVQAFWRTAAIVFNCLIKSNYLLNWKSVFAIYPYFFQFFLIFFNFYIIFFKTLKIVYIMLYTHFS